MVPVKLLNVSTRLEIAVQERSNTPSILVVLGVSATRNRGGTAFYSEISPHRAESDSVASRSWPHSLRIEVTRTGKGKRDGMRGRDLSPAGAVVSEH